jgi:hypothetical protein
MKTKDIRNIASAALGTATLTFLACWSASMEVGAEADALPSKIAKPKLMCKGVEMTIAAVGGGVLKPGDEPVFELAAVNTTSQPATVAVRVVMSSSSPADALSRVIRLPARLWQEERSLVLAPRETQTGRFSSNIKVPTNALISVSLQEAGDANIHTTPVLGNEPTQPTRVAGEPGVVALTFSTVSAPTLTTVVVAR